MAQRPGLLVRDPFRYSDATLIVPPLLVNCLNLLDGKHSELDLRARLTQLTGHLDVADIASAMLTALADAAFLNDDGFKRLRTGRQREFASRPTRTAAHAGGGYPVDATQLGQTLVTWMSEAPPRQPEADVIAIAAPHASPHAAVATYAAAFAALPLSAGDRTFVVLGTSHYGAPSSFGLTRKPFQTPLGTATTDTALVDALARGAPESFTLDDYCQVIEHSIEFQVVFLQHRFGPSVRILPILVGPFLQSHPEDEESVAGALGALGELQAKHAGTLSWVLGVDMAHMGRRYGDPSAARAHDVQMAQVAARDHQRLERIANADADGFWQLVGGSANDELKWCGAAPFYSFLRAVPEARGQTLHYDQWNIDDDSVVSFAALSFSDA